MKTGKVKVTYRSMCTATCHRERAASLQQGQFNSQQVAAYAAGKQNLFWNYAELFYHQQGSEGTGYANDAYLTGLAKQIPGLNVSTWQSDRNNAGLKAQVAADGAYATRAALAGKQTLIVTGKKSFAMVPGNSPVFNHLPSPSELAKAVQNVS